MTKAGSYSQVLKAPGIRPFLWMQFLNAFNDNVYKLVVSLLAVLVTTSKATSGTYLSIAGFVFIAPFLLFSGYAGQLADQFEKRKVVVFTKALEIVAMVCACAALVSGSIEWMLAVLFLTATQAAFFSPAKYGIVPELVADKDLARANGLLEMSTFVAIILGTVGGSYAVAAWKNQPAIIGFLLIAIAVAGTLTSLQIRRTNAPVSRTKFSWNPLGELATGLRRLAADRFLLLTVLGTTFFWFLGALLQMILLLFGKETLHCTETQTGMLMASLAVGIGTGSMAAGRLSGETVEVGLIPLGAFGMAAAALALAVTAHTLLPALLLLALLGFTGGLFVVPLNAVLQHRPQAEERGRVLATANVVNTIGIMLASGVVWLLHEALHLSAARIIAATALLTFIAAGYALQLAPSFATRFLLYLLTRLIYRVRVSGADNVPAQGAALLVANHVSFVDGFLIASCLRRLVRFLVTEEWYDRFPRAFGMFHAIRVPSGNRRSIIESIERARQQLQEGYLVCIFAEGALTSTGNIGEFHRGLEKIVAGLDAPVIPVHLGGVWGSIFSLDRQASLRRSLRKLPFPIRVGFGKPMMQPSAFAVRQAVSELGVEAAQESISDNESLGKRFVRTAKKHWSDRAMTDATGRTLSYGQALIASQLLAKRIHQSHSNEQMIGVMLPSSVAAALINLGIVLADRIPVNMNFTAGREAIDSSIEQCGLRTIITSQQFLTKSGIEKRPEIILAEDLLLFGKTAKLLAFLRTRLLPSRWTANCSAQANDLAAVLFSSGSTGAPKGVMLSHRNLLSNTDSVHYLFQIDETDTIAGVLPLFHSFGFTYTLWFPLLHGASVAYHSQPLDTKGFGELVERTKATFLSAPPTFCQAYLRGCSRDQFASLRHVLVGAEKLSPKLADAFKEKFGIPLLEGYGATEMSPVISVNVPDRERAGVKQTGHRPGTVGQTIPGVAAKVIHRETGEVLPEGEEGMLLVKGPNRMLSYLHRAEETEAVLRDGWYVTGDIAVMDKDGFIRLVDRQSRFSKIAGEMVPHGRVEEILQSIVGEARCVVTAVADDRKGERLVAFVAGIDTQPQAIWQQLLSSELPKLWIPKVDDIHVVETLPMLGTGKVDLRTVRQMALAA